MADTTDLLIIGGGCAGLTAAIYAIRAGLSATVLEGGFAGGKSLLPMKSKTIRAM